MPSALQLMNESPNCRTYTHSATDFRVFPNLLMMPLSVGGNCDLLLTHRMTNVTPMNRLHYTQLHFLSWLLLHLLLAIKSKLQCCKLSQEWATGRISSKLCKKSRDFLTFKPPLHSLVMVHYSLNMLLLIMLTNIWEVPLWCKAKKSTTSGAILLWEIHE